MPQEKLTRIRRVRHGQLAPYYSASRQTAQDKELSYEALGVLNYLLSKPDDWMLRPTDLQRKGCHRDKIYRILRELIDAHYIDRLWGCVTETNQVVEILYLVYEEPFPDFPDTELPDRENPHVTYKRTLHKTDPDTALRTDDGMGDPDDPSDSDVYAELSGRTKNGIQDKNFVEFTDTDPAMYQTRTITRSLPNPTVVQPGFKNVPVVKSKPEPKRNTPPTELEQYLLKHMANVAPNQWVRETSRLSAENRVKLSTAVTDSMSPEWLWDHDPRFKEWVQERGHWFIANATKKNQNTLVNLVCKYDTEEYGWYAWCDQHPKPLTLSPAEALKVKLDNWVRAYYDPRKENGMLNVEDEQTYDRMKQTYQDALDNQVK